MATLESLPRELRQHIFAFVFDHAISEDLKLNEFIRMASYSHFNYPTLRDSILDTPWRN